MGCTKYLKATSKAISQTRKGSWRLLQNKTIIRCCFIAILFAFAGDWCICFYCVLKPETFIRLIHRYEVIRWEHAPCMRAWLLLNPAAVSRNYNPLVEIQFEEYTSFMLLGTQRYLDDEAVSEDFVESVDRLTAAGGRLVMAFLPVGDRGRKCLPCGDAQQEDSESPAEADSEQNHPAGSR